MDSLLVMQACIWEESKEGRKEELTVEQKKLKGREKGKVES